MIVKLKVVHGALKNKRGDDAGGEISIDRPNFIIGSGKDCNMRCMSKTISAQHCKLTVTNESAGIQDLGSESGTFVNDQRVTDEHTLRHGDRLRVGRLEFEVAFDRTMSMFGGPKEADSVADYVSDLLVEADEEERSRRLEDPAKRQYQVQKNVAKPKQESAADEGKRAKLKRPEKKPPGKLPPPPQFTADSSVVAAEETLKKMFSKPKK